MPAIGRLTKELMVTELADSLKRAPGVIVTSFRAMTVRHTEELRSQLLALQGNYLVAKQSLSRRALEAAGLGELAGTLAGPVALVLTGPDASRTSKTLLDFIRAHEGTLEVRGAFVDRQVVTPSTVKALAALPSRAQLLAELVATIASPVADLIMTVERLFQDVTYAIDEVGKQKAAARPVQAEPAPMETPKPESQTEGPERQVA